LEWPVLNCPRVAGFQPPGDRIFNAHLARHKRILRRLSPPRKAHIKGKADSAEKPPIIESAQKTTKSVRQRILQDRV